MHAASEFLKSLSPKKVIVATPFATASAMDRLLSIADEIVCLEVLDELQAIEHYYEHHEVPSHEVIYEAIKEVILRWQ